MSLNKVPNSMEESPGSGSVPAGGTTGQSLVKLSSADGDVAWQSPTAIPSGGTTGQALIKNSNANGDAGWSSVGTGDMVIAGVQTVTGAKTFNDGTAKFAGSTSGTTTVKASAVAGTTTMTLPAANDQFVGRATTDTLSNKTFVAPALGTPLSGTLTNCDGLPVATGIAGMGSNVAALLTTFSSANLRTALTDETGTGAAVFATSPTLAGAVGGTFTLPATATLVSSPSQGDNSLKLASTAYVDSSLGTTQALSSTTLTINSGNTGTYNGNTIAATNASAQTITIASGAALTRGLLIEQLGAGLVTVAASGVTLNAPNGLTTAGARTTLVIVYEAADVYSVFARPTADSTQTISSSGASPSLDMAKYLVFDVTMTAATVTPSFVGMVSGQAFQATVIYRQDGTGSRLLGAPTGTKTYLTDAGGGTAPTLPTAAASIQVMTYLTLDAGTSWLIWSGGRS
jgi:hypothetical protein